MKLAESLNFWAASSTEGASRLQMLQVGAQNQNTVGRSATAAPSNSPPPTNGAVKRSASGTAFVAEPESDAASGALGADPPEVESVAGCVAAASVGDVAVELSEPDDEQAAIDSPRAIAPMAARWVREDLTAPTVATCRCRRAAEHAEFPERSLARRALGGQCSG